MISEVTVVSDLAGGLKIALLFALLGMSTRLTLAATAFVLSRPTASKDIFLILIVGSMIVMAALVAARFLHAPQEMQPVTRLVGWLAIPCVLAFAVGAWVMSDLGTQWQALLADAPRLWKIGHNAESAALRALLLSLLLVGLAGFVLAGLAAPTLAFWSVFLATVLLVINTAVMPMILLLMAQASLMGLGGEIADETGAILAALIGAVIFGIWQASMNHPAMWLQRK